MTVLVIAIYAACVLTALLAGYYVVQDFAADLVLLGACALMLVLWVAEGVFLGLRDAAGGDVSDPITLYGYLLTAVAMSLGGLWLGVVERSRWGSGAIAIVAVTAIVLQMRLPQIWPGGF